MGYRLAGAYYVSTLDTEKTLTFTHYLKRWAPHTGHKERTSVNLRFLGDFLADKINTLVCRH